MFRVEPSSDFYAVVDSIESEEYFDDELAEIAYFYPENELILDAVARAEKSDYHTLNAFIDLRSNFAINALLRNKQGRFSSDARFLLKMLHAENPSWVSFFVMFDIEKELSGSYFPCIFSSDDFAVSEFGEEGMFEELSTVELYTLLKLLIKNDLLLDRRIEENKVCLGDGRTLWGFTFDYAVRALQKSYATLALTPAEEERKILATCFEGTDSNYLKVVIYSILKDFPEGEELLKKELPFNNKSGFINRALLDASLRKHESTVRTLFFESVIPLLKKKSYPKKYVNAAAGNAVNTLARHKDFQEAFMNHFLKLMEGFTGEADRLQAVNFIVFLLDNGMNLCEYEDIIIEAFDSCKETNSKCFDRLTTLVWEHPATAPLPMRKTNKPVELSDKFYAKLLEHISFGTLQGLVSYHRLLPSEEVVRAALRDGHFDEFPDEEVSDSHMLEPTADIYYELLTSEKYSTKLEHYILVLAHKKNLLQSMSFYNKEDIRTVVERVADSEGISAELPYSFRERVVLVECFYEHS